MEKTRTKYIITDFGEAIGYGAFGGKVKWAQGNLENYYLQEGEDKGVTTRKYDQAMIVRLHSFDGREWQYQEVEESYVKYLDHFRLVYESKTSASPGLFEDPKEDDIKLIKIFEYVKGAKIAGKALIGTKVEISTRLKTNQQREFVYTKKAEVNNGKFEFIVPYSTFSEQGWLGNGTKFEVFAEPYTIKINGLQKTINVSEEDVLEGNTIIINI